MSTNPTPLDIAAQALRDADASLSKAKERRDAAMYDVIKLMPDPLDPDGITSTETLYFKISVVGRMNRSVDQKAMNNIEMDMRPGAFSNAFTSAGYRLNLKGLRVLEHSEPDQYAIAATAITAKPGKPSVTINLTDQE